MKEQMKVCKDKNGNYYCPEAELMLAKLIVGVQPIDEEETALEGGSGCDSSHNLDYYFGSEYSDNSKFSSFNFTNNPLNFKNSYFVAKDRFRSIE